MKKIIVSVMFSALSVVGTAQAAAVDKAALMAEGKQIFMEFGKTLQGHLKGGLENGGPTKAIEVCSQLAPSVAADLSAKYGVELGRTSLKLRNPDNAPDAWEKGVLQKFEERKAAGEDVKKIAYSEVVSEGGKQYFRMMVAIPTAEQPCLACHGGSINEGVANKLDSLYPADQARGFKAGDIRGASSLKKAL
jgi:hypothetical protein